MSSTVVYATSTVAANAHRTALAGINRVAMAPVYWCSECGTESNSPVSCTC